MIKVSSSFERLLSPFVSVYQKFDDTIDKIAKFFVLPLFIIFSMSALYQFIFTNENDIQFEEFVLKKNFKNSKYKALDIYSPAHFSKVKVQGPTNVYGHLEVYDSQLNDTNIYGFLFADRTHFQDVNVYGPCTLKNIHARDIEVYGILNASHLVIQNDLFIAGSASLKKSKIKFCELMGEKLILDEVSIKKLKVSNTEQKKVIIHLHNSTVDHIVFEQVHGEVLMYGEKNLVTSVKGGTVIKTKKTFIAQKDDIKKDPVPITKNDGQIQKNLKV